jgi:hypothetical protein
VSKASAEALWQRALVAISKRGFLPERAYKMTPREIARAVRQRGDKRLEILVSLYYYPVFFGETVGTLGEEQAARLVAEIEKVRSTIEPAEIEQTGSAHKPTGRAQARKAAELEFCHVCGKQSPEKI